MIVILTFRQVVETYKPLIGHAKTYSSNLPPSDFSMLQTSNFNSSLSVFVFANIDDFKDLLDPLQDVATTFKSKIMFIHVDINDENLSKPFLTLFGLEESKNTEVAAFDNGIFVGIKTNTKQY